MTFVVLVPKSSPIVANTSSPAGDSDAGAPLLTRASNASRFSTETVLGGDSRTGAWGGSSQNSNGGGSILGGGGNAGGLRSRGVVLARAGAPLRPRRVCIPRLA